jgi:glycerol-3-phosphate acyltransferase PlsX
MRIALDAMGSDAFPVPDVAGAVQAAAEYGETIVLVGDAPRIKAELTKHNTQGLPIEIVHASQNITMEDKPADSARHKSDSSMHVGMGLVEQGQAEAFVTCGNTGAALAIATLYKIKRIRGIHRATLCAVVPFRAGPVVLTDLGANVDCKPEWLLQFAQMGHLYARLALKLERPRVALISNGEEEGKGNALIHEASPLLAASDSLNYIGNIEPKEMVKGVADVVVCDGFVGNIITKTLEAMGLALFDAIKDSVQTSRRAKIGALLMRPAFRKIYKQHDPAEIGGALLLGVNGVVIIAHGRSDARAVKNAVRQAIEAVNGGMIQAIHKGLAAQKSS